MSKIECNNVCVKTSTIDKQSDGAFAKIDFKKGQLVEKGIVRRMDVDFDGMNNPYVFTWSDDIPNNTWAWASGCMPYYNSALDDHANTRMVRHFDENRFEVFATRDITKGEELMHRYKSLDWRTAFRSLNV